MTVKKTQVSLFFMGQTCGPVPVAQDRSPAGATTEDKPFV
jgi:hypothetical protein